MRSYSLFSVALWFVLSPMAVMAQLGGGPVPMKQIKQTIAKVRSDKTVNDRTEAAEHLANLTRELSKRKVTEALVTDITSLLDSPDDSVRYGSRRPWEILGLQRKPQRLS